MNKIMPQEHIFLSFSESRSKHFSKVKTWLKRFEFSEEKGKIVVMVDREPEHLGNLYHLLSAIYSCNNFNGVDASLDGIILSVDQLKDLMETLSCYKGSERTKSKDSHCLAVYRMAKGSVSAFSDDPEDVMLLPCKRTFDKMHASKINADSFNHSAAKHMCDVCPLFTTSKVGFAKIDGYGNLIESTRTYIE